MAGAKLGKHIRSMLWTTIPPFPLSLVLFFVLGFSQSSQISTATDIAAYIEALHREFQIGFVTLPPAVFLIVPLLLKVNAIVALGLSSTAAGIVAMVCQHATLQNVIRVAYNGYTSQIEPDVLKTVLNRGGMASMLQYVAIITFAVGMGGMLECLGVLDCILRFFVKRIRSGGTLILAMKLVAMQPT